MKFLRSIGIWLLVLAAVVSATAQDEPIRVETDLITVNVAVTDKQGRFVKNLRKEQFELFDNKAKQSLSHFSAGSAPVSLGIVYDMHPTTGERTKAVLESLRRFTKEFGEDDRFFIVSFNERGYLKTDFIPTVEQLDKTLIAGVPRSLYDAIYLAAERLRESRNLKRAILIISDGADHDSHHSFAELRRKLKNFDAQIYALIFDEAQMRSYADITQGVRRKRITNDASGYDRAALQGLTLRSGGTANYPATENADDLYRIYTGIYAEMCEFYTLSFYPTGAADGKWHRLRIGLSAVEGGGKLTLTYRQGYQSPPPKP